MTVSDLERFQRAQATGSISEVASALREIAQERTRIDTSFRFTVCDHMWRPMGELGGDLMEASGTDPRNDLPTAHLKIKPDSMWVPVFMNCTKTMVGVIVETAGLRWAFYVRQFDLVREENSEPYGSVTLHGIWDILSHMVIWPSWWLPIQTQPFSHAIYIWALCTVIESMIAECALRLQAGWMEFINNALSLNPDVRAWFGSMLQALKRDGLSIETFTRMLRTPVYVVRTNPLTDTSPLAARTVRMESCASVIKDITRAYGVTVNVDLWLPGDPQPDQWVRLDQPTYVVTVKDRSQIEGPTKTVLDSVLRTVVDLGGSIGEIFNPIIQQVPGMAHQFHAPLLGVNYVPPWAILVVPDAGQDGNVLTWRISHHTQTGWQHIIGGRSPKWLNDIMNAFFAWVIDSIMIVVGFTGIPSDLLAGFLNNAFFAFQLIQNYGRRDEAGPYHPAIERFHATASAPYNVQTVADFINAFWDSRGYASAQVSFRNGKPLTLGKDLFKGSLVSVVYHNRSKMITDYVENILWQITPSKRDVIVQIGDGKAEESPLAKHQRFITALFEAVNVITLAPQSG